jgi:hypothetical protein
MLFDFGGPSAAGGQSVADASGRKLAQDVLSTRLPSLIQMPTVTGPEITLAVPLHDKKGLKEIAVLRF